MDKFNKSALLKKMPSTFGFTVSFDEHLQNESTAKQLQQQQQINMFRSKSSTIFSRSKLLKKLSTDTLKCPENLNEFPENVLYPSGNKRKSFKSSSESVNSMRSRQNSIDENSEVYFCTEERPAICERLISLRLKLRRCSVSMDSRR